MAAQSVRVSLPTDLLREIDGRAETRSDGRSAVIQRALRLYLDHARRQETDLAHQRACVGRANDVLDEPGPVCRAAEVTLG
jgi:metal-responsive CopG/Arc/MetJ family transcriptional regulator